MLGEETLRLRRKQRQVLDAHEHHVVSLVSSARARCGDTRTNAAAMAVSRRFTISSRILIVVRP